MYYTLGPVLCFILIVINVKAASIKKISVDIGKNVTIKCPLNSSRDVMWEREGKKQDQNIKMTVLENGTLFLQGADKNDSGIYSCIRENDVKDIRGKVNVTVRTPPPPLIVSIKPSTILVLVLWEVNGTGGYPIIYFTAQYRLAFTNNSWIPISPNHIMPNSRQLEVYSLLPNTTYEFRMWATNQLGKSPIVNVLVTTRGQYSEIVEEEPEIIELVPNIILNPGFEGPSHFNDITPDENSNNETPIRLNNNTVVQPQNL